MNLETALRFLLGTASLAVGTGALLRGASRLAAAVGIPASGAGVTVAPLCASAGVLFVSAYSSFQGNADISLATIIGGNVFSLLFVLGVCALPGSLAASPRGVRYQVAILIGLSAILLLSAADGLLSPLEGLLLLCGALAIALSSIRQVRMESAGVRREDPPGREYAWAGWPVTSILIVSGIALLVLGARWILPSAMSVARSFGRTDVIVGLILVAPAASLPVALVAAIATLREKPGVAVTSVLSGGICNLTVVLGIAILVSGSGLRVREALARFDLPVMATAAFVCLPLIVPGRRIARWQGAVLIGYAIAYAVYLWFADRKHHLLPVFSPGMIAFVLPLILLTAGVVSARVIRGRALADGSKNPV